MAKELEDMTPAELNAQADALLAAAEADTAEVRWTPCWRQQKNTKRVLEESSMSNDNDKVLSSRELERQATALLAATEKYKDKKGTGGKQHG